LKIFHREEAAVSKFKDGAGRNEVANEPCNNRTPIYTILALRLNVMLKGDVNFLWENKLGKLICNVAI
jgi:hypothetical protein